MNGGSCRYMKDPNRDKVLFQYVLNNYHSLLDVDTDLARLFRTPVGSSVTQGYIVKYFPMDS